MSAELTPEQEKQVQERLQEQENKIREEFDDRVGRQEVWLLRIMKEHFGEEAYQIYMKEENGRVRRNWSKIAEENGDNSIESLIKRIWEPLPSSFEYTMEKTEAGVQFKCTKCPIADRALRLGVGEQMYYAICSNDFAAAEGFNPNIGFTMTKTLMQGDGCCNHFYYYKDTNIKENYYGQTIPFQPEPLPSNGEQLLAAIGRKNIPHKKVEVNAEGHIIADKDIDPELYDWAVNG
jgi:predicted ArsR family transcriptional regulator